MPAPKLLAIVLPARNEAAVIGQVLAAIPRAIEGMSVALIVVDDGSTDRTSEVARSAGATVIRHTVNLGVGAATISGLRAARLMDADLVATMDADGQHGPGEIERLVQCLIGGNFDVVIGSRIEIGGMPLTRIFANLLMNAVTFIVYRKIVADSQSGLKVFSKQAVRKLDLRASGYEICSEIIGEIYRNKLAYKSLPIEAVYTDYSKAKGQHFLNGVNVILRVLMRLMRRV